jgi:hypothetical protein
MQPSTAILGPFFIFFKKMFSKKIVLLLVELFFLELFKVWFFTFWVFENLFGISIQTCSGSVF